MLVIAVVILKKMAGCIVRMLAVAMLLAALAYLYRKYFG